MVMIGVSEYSTAYLSADGKKLIENAILYLLGVEKKQTDAIEDIRYEQAGAKKILREGRIYILRGEELFTINGTPVR